MRPAQPIVTPRGISSVARASVIIVNYDGCEDLARCLPSLVDAQGPEPEIILVDNRSTDGSVAYVQNTFPQVRIIRNGSNRGFGGASNVGAGEARGEYLVFLNPDTVVERGWLAPLVSVLESDPSAGLVTSKILLLTDPERINTCGNAMHCSGLTLCRGMGMGSAAFAIPDEINAVSGAAFAVRRTLYETLGGFDETFFMYMEDTDLSLRARLAGYRNLYVPASIVHHDYRLRFGVDKTFYQERNRYLMLLKNLRWGTLVVLLPTLLLGEVVTWGFVFLRDRRRWVNKLRAYGWILTHWRLVMEKRRRAQATRRARDRDILAACTHRLSYGQAADGVAARFARAVFDPLFFLLHRLALLFVWW